MVFCFVQKFFFGQHKSQNIFFFQNLTLSYMTKALNQIIFFSSTKIRIFFSATLGIRIFFQKKTITPSFKLNGRSLIKLIRGGNKDIHNIYKTVQRSEPSHTQYLESYSEERTNTYTILKKGIIGQNQDIHNIYKTIQGREPTHTQYLHIYKSIQWRELTHTRTFTKLFRGVN